jgi:hypothetical protein
MNLSELRFLMYPPRELYCRGSGAKRGVYMHAILETVSIVRTNSIVPGALADISKDTM